MPNIKVRVTTNRFGDAIIYPIRKDIRNAITEYLAQWKVTAIPATELIPLHQVQDVLGLTNTQVKDLEGGWDQTIIMDSWHLLSLYGWDAHEGITVTRRKSFVRSY